MRKFLSELLRNTLLWCKMSFEYFGIENITFFLISYLIINRRLRLGWGYSRYRTRGSRGLKNFKNMRFQVTKGQKSNDLETSSCENLLTRAPFWYKNCKLCFNFEIWPKMTPNMTPNLNIFLKIILRFNWLFWAIIQEN